MNSYSAVPTDTYFQLAYYALGVFAVLVAFVIIAFFVRRSGRGSRLDTIAGLDLTSKSTLLTPEEKSKIRAAQARLVHQVELDEQRKKNRPSPATLLADPTVIALTERVRPVQGETVHSEPKTENLEVAKDYSDLPAEVAKMAELGLITAEEVQNIRNRIQDKKRQLSQESSD